MNDSGEIWLAIIAVAVMLMAVIQMAVVVVGLRVARRVEHRATELEAAIRPLLSNLTAFSADVSRTAAMAAAQVERLDRLLSDVTTRLDQTLAAVQRLITRPAREGVAVMSGVRAAIGALQALRENARRRGAVRLGPVEDDEESLFIG